MRWFTISAVIFLFLLSGCAKVSTEDYESGAWNTKNYLHEGGESELVEVSGVGEWVNLTGERRIVLKVTGSDNTVLVNDEVIVEELEVIGSDNLIYLPLEQDVRVDMAGLSNEIIKE